MQYSHHRIDVDQRGMIPAGLRRVLGLLRWISRWIVLVGETVQGLLFANHSRVQHQHLPQFNPSQAFRGPDPWSEFMHGPVLPTILPTIHPLVRSVHAPLPPVHARNLLVHPAFGRSESYVLPSRLSDFSIQPPLIPMSPLWELLPASSSPNTNTSHNASVYFSRGFRAVRVGPSHPSLGQWVIQARILRSTSRTDYSTTVLFFRHHPNIRVVTNQSGNHNHSANPGSTTHSNASTPRPPAHHTILSLCCPCSMPPNSSSLNLAALPNYRAT